MPVLFDITNSSATVVWETNSGVEFYSTSGVEWSNDAGHLRVALSDFQGNHFWEGLVVGVTAPKYQMDTPYGGMIRFSVGSIDLALKALDATGFWPFSDPYPEYFNIEILWTDDMEENAISLISGTALIVSLDVPTKVSLELFPLTIDKDLLTEATDYNNQTVPLPIAFGKIEHANPVRLADAGGGNQRYCLSYLGGDIGVDWFVYDDGVDVSANVTNVADNVFELTAAPVGELTVSGYGIASGGFGFGDTNLGGIVETLCGATYLNIPYVNYVTDYSWLGSQTVDVWQKDQIKIFDFLSNICAASCTFFYIRDGILYLNDTYAPLRGSANLDIDNDCLEATYNRLSPTSIVSSTIEEAISFEGATTDPLVLSKYVKRNTHKISYSLKFNFGEEKQVNTYVAYNYGYGIFGVQSELTGIEYFLNEMRATITIPLGSFLFEPGYVFWTTDNRFSTEILGYFLVYDISYDFYDHKMILEGPLRMVA